MVTASTVPHTPRRAAPRREHRFYVTMAAATALVALVGFGPTYYFRTRAPANGLTPLIELHGIVFTAWMLLHLTQTALAASGRVRWHRQFGAVGGVWAGVLLIVGYLTTIEAAQRGYNPAAWRDSYAFMAVPLIDLIVFAGLIVPALWWRRTPQTHKPLMLLATISLLGAAFIRIPFAGSNGVVGLIPYCAMALACPVWDYVATGRLHPAALWGSLWVVLTVPIRFALAQTEAWHRVAVWLAALSPL